MGQTLEAVRSEFQRLNAEISQLECLDEQHSETILELKSVRADQELQIIELRSLISTACAGFKEVLDSSLEKSHHIARTALEVLESSTLTPSDEARERASKQIIYQLQLERSVPKPVALRAQNIMESLDAAGVKFVWWRAPTFRGSDFGI